MENRRFNESSIPVLLRPNDFDADQLLNNSVYLQLLELGRWNWLEINKINFQHRELAGVVSDLYMHYLKPVFWEPHKSLDVKTILAKVNFYSLKFSQEIYEKEKLMAKADLRLALYDKKKASIVKINIEY